MRRFILNSTNRLSGQPPLLFLLVLLLLLIGLWRVAAAAAAPSARSTVSPFSCADVTEIPQRECEALVALYQSTAGPNWSNHGGWLTTDEVCSWFGVTCNNGHITELHLERNGLHGPIPFEIADLTFVQTLNFVLNRSRDISGLHGTIPPELGNLTHLQEYMTSTGSMKSLDFSLAPAMEIIYLPVISR